jgi:hypothetical protein
MSVAVAEDRVDAYERDGAVLSGRTSQPFPDHSMSAGERLREGRFPLLKCRSQNW